MFGLSFGEILVLVIVGVIFLGPRRLPEIMRTAGRWITKLRRLSTDLRAQSGIDDLIRQEGLETEIRELRSLSRINVIDTLMTPTGAAGAAGATATAKSPQAKPKAPKSQPLRHREYPLTGCDSYGALADDIPPRPRKAGAPEAPKAGAETNETPQDAPAEAEAQAEQALSEQAKESA